MQMSTDDVRGGAVQCACPLTRPRSGGGSEWPAGTRPSVHSPDTRQQLVSPGLRDLIVRTSRARNLGAQSASVATAAGRPAGDSPDPRVSDNLFNYTLFINRNNRRGELKFVDETKLMQ